MALSRAQQRARTYLQVAAHLVLTSVLAALEGRLKMRQQLQSHALAAADGLGGTGALC